MTQENDDATEATSCGRFVRRCPSTSVTSDGLLSSSCPVRRRLRRLLSSVVGVGRSSETAGNTEPTLPLHYAVSCVSRGTTSGLIPGTVRAAVS
jgi:hypothetical protein